MTRRKFIRKLVKTCSFLVVGIGSLTARAAPRKFVTAIGIKKYPGRLKSLPDVTEQAAWRG